ncbi:FKBP-like protein [Rickenella mellea]|uniref:Peptidyl-prolyl cis-trans isomerase n=1 Tax=Rickenella mellea TaxID=50990 RepID=A0A4Y7PTM1_9AGAM|nr:FKBP-like protein [Rickenella mellea]
MRSREPSRERCTAVNVRHILCSNFSKAKEALAKIREDGQRFDEVAAKYSEDRAKVGGSMGWMSKGSFQEQSALEKAAFELEPSTLDDPIVSNLIITNYGYHIILVEGRR